MVIKYLKYGWPANRLPAAPPPTIGNKNHASATKFPEFVSQYLSSEIKKGAVMGPFEEVPFDHGRVGVSPLSTRPKRDTDDRRVILDLSYPEGRSVNDHTPKDNYLGWTVNLVYPSVDDLARHMWELQGDCYMVKRDASRCFQWIPWDPMDYSLFRWFK